MASQRVVLVDISLARLAECLGYPVGATIQRVQPKWPPGADGYDSTLTMVVEDPDLPEVPNGGLIPQAKPRWTWQPYRQGPVFVDWGILKPEPEPAIRICQILSKGRTIRRLERQVADLLAKNGLLQKGYEAHEKRINELLATLMVLGKQASAAGSDN